MSAVRQLSPEWFAARRSLITASDIPVLLGLSKYTSEAELAERKASGTEQPSSLPMRIGTALEPLIAEAYTERTGRKLRRWGVLAIHPEHAFAGASPDWRTLGERRLVETKWTTSRARFADGLPQDIEAQVVWQLGVTGYPVADVAAIVADDLADPFEVEAQPAVFADMLDVARDFLRRLEAGGPFAHNAASLKRAYPSDSGNELLADPELTEAALALIRTRRERKALEGLEEALETAIKTRMADASVLVGQGFRATWKRTKDREETDWRSLAAGLLRQLPETEGKALVGIHSSVREGFRPFRLTATEDSE